jgi:predicted nucleotidyltransferase
MIELFEFDIEKIFTLFAVSPGSRWNRKIIKEKTRIPNIILDKCLAKLLNLKILNKEKNLFALNFKNGETKKIIDIVYESYNKFKQPRLKDYFIVRDTSKKLAEIKETGDVYLFGSYAKLVHHENSDIDIAIVSDNIDKKKVNETIRKLEKKYGKKIEIHFFSRKFYNNKRDPLVKEILQHGIKLL